MLVAHGGTRVLPLQGILEVLRIYISTEYNALDHVPPRANLLFPLQGVRP